MLLVMWTVAPNGWFRGVSRKPAELPAGTARTSGVIMTVESDQATLNGLKPTTCGACSLPRHTIRERID
jgi:hypothetical protein